MAVKTILTVALLVMCGSLAARAASPVEVTAGSGIANPRQPQAAVDQQGAIYIAFGAGDAVYCAVSTDGGKRFDPPVKIGQMTRLALGMRRGPRVAAGQGVAVVTAISHESGDLLSWRSTDGGKVWQEPVRVNDSPRDAREGLHAMAMGTGGQLYCAWLDLRSQRTEIYGASSTDGGATWSTNRKIYSSPSGSVCECCHPSVTLDRDGAVYVMWRNAVDGARDMYFSVSADGGETFSPAEKLGHGSWILQACPMDGGSLAITAPGKVTSIWRRDQRIFRTTSTSKREEQLGRGMQPWAAATAAGAWLTWISRRGGDLWLLAPGAPRPTKLATAAVEPVVAAPVTGTGPIVVVWEAATEEGATILSTAVAEP